MHAMLSTSLNRTFHLSSIAKASIAPTAKTDYILPSASFPCVGGGGENVPDERWSRVALRVAQVDDQREVAAGKWILGLFSMRLGEGGRGVHTNESLRGRDR